MKKLETAESNLFDKFSEIISTDFYSIVGHLREMICQKLQLQPMSFLSCFKWKHFYLDLKFS